MSKGDYNKGARLETIRIFFRYLPLILSIVILATGITIVSNLTKPDYYDGHVRLMVTPKSDRVELVRASRYQATIGLRELMNTEMDFIKSWPLVQKAAVDTDPEWQEILNNDPDRRAGLMASIQSRLRVLQSPWAMEFA